MSAKWQGWASFALGLWLALSPWIAGYAEHHAATGNAVAMGLILALASHFDCVAGDAAPAEWLNFAVGVWLICAPFTLEFPASKVAAVNSIAVGIFAAALAVSALSLEKHLGKLWHRT